MTESIHPTVVIDEPCAIGEGTRVWHFSHICTGATIGCDCSLGQNTFVAAGAMLGDRVKVQNNVSIFDGVTIEDDVFLGPSCVLTNITNPRAQVSRRHLYESTLVRRGATIGANATLLCGVTIGRYAFIGAGAVVTADVVDYALMLGTPARKHGWMSRHGHSLQPNDDGCYQCPESGWRYEENATGQFHCLDHDEDKPLPANMARGEKSYPDFAC